jgi:hypothetical protein
MCVVNFDVMETAVTMMPNPATNHIYVKGALPGTKIRVVEEATGRVMAMVERQGLFTAIDVTSWSSAAYIVQVFDKDRLVTSSKIIKL